MKKPSEVVIKETTYIASFVCVFSLVLQIVFVFLKKWNYTVLLGNLLSGALAVTNFLLMGIALEKAVSNDEKQARSIVRTSQSLRQIMIFVVTAIGVLLPCFNNWTVILPLFFPRIAISLRPLFGKNKD